MVTTSIDTKRQYTSCLSSGHLVRVILRIHIVRLELTAKHGNERVTRGCPLSLPRILWLQRNRIKAHFARTGQPSSASPKWVGEWQFDLSCTRRGWNYGLLMFNGVDLNITYIPIYSTWSSGDRAPRSHWKHPIGTLSYLRKRSLLILWWQLVFKTACFGNKSQQSTIHHKPK